MAQIKAELADVVRRFAKPLMEQKNCLHNTSKRFSTSPNAAQLHSCTPGKDQNTENRLKTHSSGGGFGSTPMNRKGFNGVNREYSLGAGHRSYSYLL
ncbi:MAG: hypothetical protein ACOCPM_06670 [Bacteroidales bacterium]